MHVAAGNYQSRTHVCPTPPPPPSNESPRDRLIARVRTEIKDYC